MASSAQSWLCSQCNTQIRQWIWFSRIRVSTDGVTTVEHVLMRTVSLIWLTTDNDLAEWNGSTLIDWGSCIEKEDLDHGVSRCTLVFHLRPGRMHRNTIRESGRLQNCTRGETEDFTSEDPAQSDYRVRATQAAGSRHRQFPWLAQNCLHGATAVFTLHRRSCRRML